MLLYDVVVNDTVVATCEGRTQAVIALANAIEDVRVMNHYAPMTLEYMGFGDYMVFNKEGVRYLFTIRYKGVD